MTYDANNYVIKKVPQAGETVVAFITEIRDGKIKDFVKGDKALAKFENPDQEAIEVTSEGKFDGTIYQCKRIFSYNVNDKNKMVLDTKSNLNEFLITYKSLPKHGLEVKHIAQANGYFKLMVKI
jgi:hypothetical protein